MAGSDDKGTAPIGGPQETVPVSAPTIPAKPEATTPIEPVTSTSQQPSVSGSNIQNREELILKARAFLQSPQIQGQDVAAQRRFLAEKGLNEHEINGLLSQNAGLRLPAVPPRNYPQPPPSNLPTLLLGLARLFSWIGMGSAALVFIYYRFLLPKLIKTAQARKALRSHHLSLMTKLTESISATKETQKSDYASLPRADPYQERSPYVECRSLSQVLKTLSDKEPEYTSLPPVTLLRCAIADLSKGKADGDANPTAEEIIRVLEGRIPWLLTEEGYTFKRSIYDTLVSCPHFVQETSPTSDPLLDGTAPPSTWKYAKPPPSEPSPTVKSLNRLSSAMPSKSSEMRTSPFSHVIETLSEFTGYISSQVYVPYQASASGFGMSSTLSPAEEQLKREIRALKGLVLNRKSFMPSIPRPGLSPRPTS